MENLDPVKKDDSLDKQEIQAKKVHEHKHLGAGKRPFKNARLFALDVDKGEIYEVEIQVKEVYEPFAKKEKAQSKARINNKHPHVWALNMKNAKKKFMKIRFKVPRRPIMGKRSQGMTREELQRKLGEHGNDLLTTIKYIDETKV